MTANAVVGMKEMLIEKGFNDFLAKPIDVSKLDAILGRWIPKEKREEGATNGDNSIDNRLAIPGVDVERGIAMTGGNKKLYKKVLAVFYKDVEKRPLLLTSLTLQTMPETDALPLFVTQVHALKSTSASIGAAEVSAWAGKIEAAGKAGNLAFIGKNLSGFAETLAKLVKGIDKALE